MKIKYSNFIIKTSESVYTPQEDTYFIEDCIKKFFKVVGDNINMICEMGCGSGYLSIILIKKFPKSFFHILDINKKAIELAKENFKINGINIDRIQFFESDLFSAIENILTLKSKKYDLIVFNPPYIPSKNIQTYISSENIEKAWKGGFNGLEIIDNFLKTVTLYLNDFGFIFILITNYNIKSVYKENVESFIKKNYNDFEIEEIIEKKIDFETLNLVILKKKMLKNKLY